MRPIEEKVMRYVLVLCLGFLLGCSDTPVGPTEVTNGNSSSFLPVSSGDDRSGPSVGVDSEPTECETIVITARRVLDVSPTSVTLRVLATYEGENAPRVRIVDRATGVLIGDFALGDITLTVRPGSYSWFVFVEVNTAGGLIQCDGSVSFVIPEPECVGDCTPPPPCTEDCEPPPTCEELENCPEPPCEVDCEPPPVCEVPFGPFPKQGNPRAECGFFGAVPASPGFYICKAGQDMFASTSPFTGQTCPNGKDISHITTCGCPVEE